MTLQARSAKGEGWGPEFYSRHSASSPNFVAPALTVNIGRLGLQHILENDESGYFPIRLVRPRLADGRLVPLEGAPKFLLSAYMAYASEGRLHFLDEALEVMRDIAESERQHVPIALTSVPKSLLHDARP